ncbi:hypothetical protein [Aquimarina celericrescens]|uniref:DUF4386 family protein n=1 Tax=Aquimarina celericrescens TaxID=1964542 RepID=A0ABW5AZ08_9FLAO|nr:hypothetical protein [Aquimarina celericrescens]
MQYASKQFEHNLVKIGTISCWGVFLLGIMYIITTALGFLSLKTPHDQIDDPFFTIMELLILFIAPLMAVSVVTAHFYNSPENRIFSMIAVLFIFIAMGITSCVHFVIIILGRYVEFTNPETFTLYFSFTWPSLVYVLDILAWDWFFAISLFFITPVFNGNRLERVVRILLIVSGILSLGGLVGIPLENMLIRNIGIIGYAVVAPFAFLLMGIVFRKKLLTADLHKHRNR